MDVFDLSASLTLDSSAYNKGLDTAEDKAHSFGTKLGKALKVGAVAFTAVTAAAGALSGVMVKNIKETAEYGDKVDKMSQKIGISAESYQKWDYVMQRAGGNVDSLKMGMKTLSQQAEKGSEAFDKLGISQKEVKDLSQEELFEKTVKGLSEMEAGTERTALASQLLGKAGADMAPLFNEGSEAIEEQMEIAEKYGMVMPKEAVKASAAFEDSVTTMQMTMQGMKNRLMGEFLPSITQVTDGLGKLFAGDMSGIDDIEKGIQGIVDKITKVLPKILKVGGKIILTLGQAFIKNAPQLIEQLVGILGELTATIIDHLPEIIKAAIQIVIAIAKGLIKALPHIVSAIGRLLKMLIKTIGNKLGDITKSGTNLVKALAKGIAHAVSNVISAGAKLIRSLIRAIVGFVGSFATAGGKIISGLVKGIRNKINAVVDKVKTYAEKIKNAIVAPIKKAKEKVEEIIEKIKDLFPFNVGKIFEGKVPQVKTKVKKTKDGEAEMSSTTKYWRFAKAMTEPYMFSQPTAFMAGEAGDEMLYGRNALLSDIKKATANSGDIIINLNYQAGNDANEMLRDIARGIRRYRMAGAF